MKRRIIDILLVTIGSFIAAVAENQYEGGMNGLKRIDD